MIDNHIFAILRKYSRSLIRSSFLVSKLKRYIVTLYINHAFYIMLNRVF